MISVIVLAHDRREFLKTAIDSLNSQTLPKSEFEVLVVKNFQDFMLDNLIRESGFNSLHTESPGLGSKLLEGINKTTGKVVTFLEDDDVYDNERLAVVHKLFSENEKLTYFHNSFLECDTNLQPRLKKQFPQVEVDSKIQSSNVDIKFLDYSYRHSGHANLSSIAVRRDSLSRLRPFLDQSNGGEDLTVLLNCTQDRGTIILSVRVLTKVRIHDSFFTSQKGIDAQQLIQWKTDRNMKYLNTYKVMSDNFYKNSTAQRWIAMHVLYKRILDSIWNSSKPLQFSFIELANFTVQSILSLDYRKILILVALIASRIAKSLGGVNSSNSLLKLFT